MERLRPLGIDPMSGKPAYALVAPGGALEAMADRAALEAGAALHALTGAILDSEQEATPEELAALVPALVAMLGDLVQVAARGME